MERQLNKTEVLAVIIDWNAPILTTNGVESVFENDKFRRSGTRIFADSELKGEFAAEMHATSTNSKERNVTSPSVA